MSRLQQKVEKCTTWKQLFHAALAADEANEPNNKGVYTSRWRFISAEELNAILHQVRDGMAPIWHVTRNHGLRAKAQELLNKTSGDGEEAL